MRSYKRKSTILIGLILALCFVLVLICAWIRTPVPKLYLQGNISGMEEKSDVRNISFVYSDGMQEHSGFAEITVQGTSSLQYEKKNYNLSFFEDASLEEPLTMNYYIITDLAWMGDNLGKNMILATYDSLHWYLSLYDMDTSWGTRYDGMLDYLYENELNNMSCSQLFVRMEEAFSKELAQRYFELRNDLLSNEKIMEEFENFEDEIPMLTFVKEALRWSGGLFHTRKALPGADYDQIEAYLNSVSDRLDTKYAAWLN